MLIAAQLVWLPDWVEVNLSPTVAISINAVQDSVLMIWTVGGSESSDACNCKVPHIVGDTLRV